MRVRSRRSFSTHLAILALSELRRSPHPAQNVDPEQTLIEYLRSPNVGLTGTKLGCGEGPRPSLQSHSLPS